MFLKFIPDWHKRRWLQFSCLSDGIYQGTERGYSFNIGIVIGLEKCYSCIVVIANVFKLQKMAL